MHAESLRPAGSTHPAAWGLAALLGWAACAGLCTLALQPLAAAWLQLLAPQLPVPGALPLGGAQARTTAFALQRMLAGPALETALLLPFAWAALHIWEITPRAPAQGGQSLRCPQGMRLSPRLRLLGATAFLALPFTAVHAASQGAQAWAALPAACLVVLALLIPLRAGQPLRAACSSFVVHAGHNALLLCAGWVLAPAWPG